MIWPQQRQAALQRPVAEDIEGEASHYQTAADKLKRPRRLAERIEPAITPTTGTSNHALPS
jgi:hypothetical protein